MCRCRRGGCRGEVPGSVAVTAFGTPKRLEAEADLPTSTRLSGDPGVARSNHAAPERHCACRRRRRVRDPRSGRGGAPAPDWTPHCALAAQMRIHRNVDERRIVHRRRVSSREIFGLNGHSGLRHANSPSGPGRGCGTRRKTSDRQAAGVPVSTGVRRAVLPFAASPRCRRRRPMKFAGTARRSSESAGCAGGRRGRSSLHGQDRR